jgi:hypothetical protein
MPFYFVRTIGLVRSNVKIGMTDIVYNMNCLIQLINPAPGTARLIWLKLKKTLENNYN